MTTKTYTKYVLTGGGTGALDAIDGDFLANNYRAMVITDDGVYHYKLDATSGATEDGFNIIAPDDNAGTKRWILKRGSADSFYPDYNAADQGVTGSNNTIKYYVDQIGSDQAIIVLRHNSGSAITTYDLDTDEYTIPSNITLKFDRGAVIDGVTGDEILTINGGIDAELLQIFGDDLTVEGYPKIVALYSAWFGTDEDNSGSDNQTYFQKWADLISDQNVEDVRTGVKGVVTAGEYDINGTIEFDGQFMTMEAYGASFNQTGTDTITVDLNNGYDPSGDVADHKDVIHWFGGYFTCDTSGDGGNTNIGIRMGDVSRSEIAYVRGDNHGDCFILFSPQDSSSLRRVSGYNNYHHIRMDQCAGGPQDNNIKDISFSASYSEGILIESLVSILTISNGYIIGSDAIVIYPWETTSSTLVIDNIDFEQGDEDEYYIQELQTDDTVALQNITIINCSFALSNTLIGKFESVRTFEFTGNYIVTDKAGFLNFAAVCDNINIGANRFSQAPSITYACDRDKISVFPYFVTTNYEILTGFNGNAFSTGTAIIDMSAVFGSFPSLIPPKGYSISVTAKDSGSAADAPIVSVQDNSGTNNSLGIYLNLSGFTNDYRQGVMGYLAADANGDLYRDFNATGEGTLDLYIAVTGYSI